MSRLIEIIRESIKGMIERKLKKKAKKKLKKFFRKLLLTAVAVFAVVMVVKHRQPIIAAIFRKETPVKKCPFWKIF